MISVVIPMYNEEAAIADELRGLRQMLDATGWTYEIIVVDDGSTDRSAEIARGFEGVRLIQHPYNRGTGAARSTGMQAAQGEIVVMIDADGTYPHQAIPLLVAEIEKGSGMAIGARKRESGTVPWLRAPTKWFIRQLASYLTATRIPDLNSGLRAMRRDLALHYLPILPTTHSWVGTITIAFLSDGYPVTWLPIDYYPRKGKSSFHPIADTYNYISLVIRSVMYFNPLKVFLPATLVLLLTAAAKLIRDIIYYRGFYVPGITLMLVLTAIQVGAIGLLADLIVKRGRG
ncbi:MAG: glycosyltransferase family 2 protein [Anaerolineae bacterium]